MLAPALAVLVPGASVLSACTVIATIKNAVHDVRGNRAVIARFNSKLKAAPTTYEADYTTSGSAPATVTYAAQLPNEVAFTLTPTAGNPNATPVHLVQNSSGEYACGQVSGHWSCARVSGVDAQSQNALFDVYTPGHWVKYLSLFALAVGLAGDKVTTSTMSRNGFSMHCIDLATEGTAGESTICTTNQGVLGYAQLAGNSTSFAITRYASSPPASDFRLPAGATITSVTVPTTAAPG